MGDMWRSRPPMQSVYNTLLSPRFGDSSNYLRYLMPIITDHAHAAPNDTTMIPAPVMINMMQDSSKSFIPMQLPRPPSGSCASSRRRAGYGGRKREGKGLMVGQCFGPQWSIHDRRLLADMAMWALLRIHRILNNLSMDKKPHPAGFYPPINPPQL